MALIKTWIAWYCVINIGLSNKLTTFQKGHNVCEDFH